MLVLSCKYKKYITLYSGLLLFLIDCNPKSSGFNWLAGRIIISLHRLQLLLRRRIRSDIRRTYRPYVPRSRNRDKDWEWKRDNGSDDVKSRFLFHFPVGCIFG